MNEKFPAFYPRAHSDPSPFAASYGEKLMEISKNLGDPWPLKKPKKGKPVQLTVNRENLLAKLKAKAAENKAKYDERVNLYDSNLEEFTALARANGRSNPEQTAKNALESLGIRKPDVLPELYADQIGKLELSEDITLEVDSDSEFFEFLDD